MMSLRRFVTTKHKLQRNGCNMNSDVLRSQ